MAEVLGIASSITALIENTVTVIKYLKDVKNASKERQEFLTELQHLATCLDGLKLTIQRSTKDDPWLATLRQFHDSDGFKQLQDLLAGLERKLKPGLSRWKRMWRRTNWTVVKDSVMDDLSRIERFKSLILIAGQHDNLTLSGAIQKTLGNIKDNVDVIRENTNVTRQLQIDGEAEKVAKWLTDLDYNAIQHDKLQERTKDTGEWFLQSSKFLDWVDPSVAPSVLWCVGGPGVGKTILASTAFNHLCIKFKEDKADKALLFCIFCDYRATDQRTITIIRSLLKQLIQTRLCLTDRIQDFYNQWSRHGMPPPPLEDITSLLSEELESYDHVYIILDALDELDDNRCRQGVLDALKGLGTQICILITSRPLDTMQSFIEAEKINIRANDADLEKCVLDRLTDGYLYNLLSKDESLHERICKTVVKKADGMFLLAKIHMDLLAHCINQAELNKELDKLPSTIEKAYGQLLDRINNLPHKDLAYHVFGWVAFAAEPLTVEDLQHALAIEPRTKQINPANITDEGILLSICAGLIVIVDIYEHRYFKFVHYSTQEYFTSQQDKLFPSIHVDITCTCLTFMSFNAHPNPFFMYSWYHWDFHARKCSGSDTAKEILAYLDDKPTWIEGTAPLFQEQFLNVDNPAFFADVVRAVKLLLADPEVDFQHINGLCLAAYAGSYFMLMVLVAKKFDVNHKDQVPFLREVPDTSLSPAQKDSSVSRGSHAPLCTPLIAAASNGHRSTVDSLLFSKELTSLNAMSSSGLTALSSAIICNSLPVVMLLLQQHDIDTSIQFQGQTPIMLAARYGFDEIMVMFLMRQDDDPNAPGENGKTVLHAAVEGSQHSSINLLLNSGQVDANRKDGQGRTALSTAASLGDVQSVKMLVDHMGINLLVRDNDGKSAYEIAVEERQDEIVALLAEHGAKDLGDE